MKTRIYIKDQEELVRIYDHPLYLKVGQKIEFNEKIHEVLSVEISLTDNCFRIFIQKV